MKRKRAVRKESGEPTWVYSKTHGWLPDECPLFADSREWNNNWYSHNELHSYRPEYFSPVHANVVRLAREGAWNESYVIPLTTAARELLAALRAERGGK